MDKIITFDGWKVPQGFRSDGCTFAPDSWFGTDLTPACIMHDWMRREDVVSTKKADKIFKRHLIHLGCPRWLAHWYWLGVKLARWWYE